MKEPNEKITEAFTWMQIADGMLKKAQKLLAEFGMNVPTVNPKALGLIADSTNSIAQSNGFIRSFIRMSMLQQVVKIKPESQQETS